MEEKRNNELDSYNKNYDKMLTIPNILTIFRMISSVALCTYIASFGITSPLLITLATLGIGATDALDGYLARNCGMASRLGSILDPIADKIYNWGLGITLMATGIMPLWPLLISIRDVTVFSMTGYQYKKNGKEMKPTLPAKAKMFFQSAGLVSTLAFGFGTSGLSLIAPICMGTAIAAVIPEIFCIKKKYFSDNQEKIEEQVSERTIQAVAKENEAKEKSKILEYPTNGLNYTNSKPKVKKKTLGSLFISHSKNNNNSDTNK